MSAWNEVKLGKVAKVISGYAFKSADFIKKPGIPAIKIKNIKNGNIDVADCDYVNEHFLKLNEKYHLNKNDILVSLTGSHLTQPNSVVGRIAMYKHSFPSLLNQRAGKVLPDQKLIDRHFLYSYLSQDSVKETIALKARGAANQANISPGDVEDTDILLPPLPTQRKIASILSAYDDLIENNLKRIKLLEEIAQRTYEEWFVKFQINGKQLKLNTETGLPEGWESINLNEVYSIKYGKNLPQTAITEKGLYPVYGASGVMGYYNTYNYKDKVVLVTSRGNGSGEIHRTYETAFVTNNSFAVFPNPGYEHLHIAFTLNFLRTLNLKSYCSGSAQPQLTNASMDNIMIKLPSKELILKFNNIGNNSIEQADILRRLNKQLKESRDIFLPKLMSGVIEVK